MYRERPSTIAGATLWRSDGGGSTVILPDGCIDVLWWNGRLVVAGPDERAHASESDPESLTLGIRFAPGTAPGLLGLPAHALTNERVELSELWERATVQRIDAELRDSGSRTTARRFEELVAGELRTPEARRARQARELAASVARGLSVSDIALRTGYSERQLHRRSREDFGYGLSTLARVLRLQRALPGLSSTATLAEVAATAGYADQAHLSREVRSLSGFTPTQLRAAKSSTELPSGSRTIA